MAETQAQFRARLKEEGRWSAFVKDREAIKESQGVNSARASSMLRDKYSVIPIVTEQILGDVPGSRANKENKQPTSGNSNSPEEFFKDTLPDGTPVVDPKYWTGRKAKISIVDEFEWVHENLGQIGITQEDAPSLSAWRMYWSARYTVAGYSWFQDLYVKLVIPDKSTLKDRQGRRDDGQVLDKLDDILGALDRNEE